MKKVLILAIGCDLDPWKEMFNTAQQTWDSIEVEGVETIFYFGHPVKENTDKCIYFPVEETYAKMGHKLLMALDWVLQNKEFDYIARVNSSCYVDKKELIKHVQTLPEKDLFAGLVVEASESNPLWVWGGGQFLLSKDVVQKIVDNREKWNHEVMEDIGLSFLVSDIGIPYTNGKACSIDKSGEHWTLIGYRTASINFTNFECLKDNGHFFYRCKQDHDRSQDKIIMEQLFNVLK